MNLSRSWWLFRQSIARRPKQGSSVKNLHYFKWRLWKRYAKVWQLLERMKHFTKFMLLVTYAARSWISNHLNWLMCINQKKKEVWSGGLCKSSMGFSWSLLQSTVLPFSRYGYNTTKEDIWTAGNQNNYPAGKHLGDTRSEVIGIVKSHPELDGSILHTQLPCSKR